MPIPLENLDDRTWEDLVQEARMIISAHAPQWTDHNPTDPGITLVEMFAYLTENLLYRINYISDESKTAFLRLVNGPDGKVEGSVDSQVRQTLHQLYTPRRAITAKDHETLAIMAGAGRARAVPERNLASGHPTAHMDPARGDTTVVILPPSGAPESDELLAKVYRALDEARLLGSRIHVTYPYRLAFSVAVRLRLHSERSVDRVRREALAALARWFDPYVGGPDGKGWPFGRNIYVSEIYQVLSSIPGVLEVMPVVSGTSPKPQPEIVLSDVASGRLRYNRLRQLEAVELLDNELPEFNADQTRLTL